MAENEILYVAIGNRWRKTRKILATSGAAVAEVATTAADELVCGIQNNLATTLRGGQSLLSLLNAAAVSQAAMRSVVEDFKDKSLARTVRDVIRVCGRLDPAVVADTAAEYVINSVLERLIEHSRRSGNYQTSEARLALFRALELRFEDCRPRLVSILEASLRGEKVRRVRQPRSNKREVKATARTVVSTSLLLPPDVSHAPQRR